ncbi:MarR family transcriptional regulator [Latilactobacillus graminis]|uniref:HTH marR-type domain-containing protein n=2 Tax=Latilactobacillus graminis TaxID=60519 RepID=A0AA89L4T8_9LACO|nr:MarR family transcriptional regulator [Latilactobacillus graminis]KRM24418.1 hypothetical protein FC90_GL000559 [Latilactobacillus graminis DSM 20719]QFP80032.1 MarR family transcriptional regulator [Latilactobacillus graminis]
MDDKIALMSQWYLEGVYLIQQLNAVCQEHDLSYDQYLVLEQIIEEKRDTPKQIADVFKTSAPAASRKVNTLQSKGFVRKIRDIDRDQRTVELEVTLDGIQRYQAIRHALTTKNRQFKPADIEHLRAIKAL